MVSLLSACNGDPDQGSGELDLPENIDYVALGDSFSSGPMIDFQRQDPKGCGRSTNNYPAYLADWLDVTTYADRTCAGARTVDVEDSQPVIFGGGSAPAQIDAVSEKTDLVTLGIGANDFNVYGATTMCMLQSLQQPCEPGLADAQVASITRMRDSLVATIRAVQERAPEAVVVVVGYPRLLPESGTCPAARVNDHDADQVRRVWSALNDAVESAANRTNAAYVDLTDASKGHDVCAGADAWVNGADSVTGQGTAFHPRAVGMRAVASEVYRLLTSKTPPDGDFASPSPSVVVTNEQSPSPAQP